MDYNPNSVWTSKKKPFTYQPKNTVVPQKSVESKAEPNTPSAQPVASKISDEAPRRRNSNAWWLVVAFVVIVAAAAGFYFFQPAQNLNVNIALATQPTNVLSGDPFTLSVSLTNDSGAVLKGASISLVLPNNVSSLDSPNQRVAVEQVGDVQAGGESNEDFHLIGTGVANTVLHFTAKVMYGSSGSSAQFENDGSADVVVGQPALGLNVSAPNNVFSGQNFNTVVNYNNNTDYPIQNVALTVQYPPAFTMGGASPSPDTGGNSVWTLGTIPANASGTITIAGNLVGPNGASYPLEATFNQNISGQAYAIADQTQSVLLATSPLSLAISVNNTANYISNAGDSLDYLLTYTNNSSVTFQDVMVSANLVGGMFDFSTLQTNGAFNSLTNTVSWNGASSPQLLSLAPGQSGSVEFHIQTKGSFPIRLLSDKDYTLGVNATVVSPTVPPGTTASSTISLADLTTKLGGKIVLATKAYAHDPSPTISDSGPYPPEVNQPTTYTIHWIITNYSTDMDNVTVSAYLQSGTTCTGEITTNGSTAPACDAANGEVSWQIPLVPATTGISGTPLEGIFQVTNTPAVNEVGQYITLIGPATLSATDGFTSTTVQVSAAPITTQLPDDTSVPANPRQVTQ